MATLTGDLTMTEMALEWKQWRLEQPLDFVGQSVKVTVPVGFTTDGASVPRPLWWFLPAWGRYSRAAVVHDYLCRTPGLCTRKDADNSFYEGMVECGVNITVRWLMWASVRSYSLWLEVKSWLSHPKS